MRQTTLKIAVSAAALATLAGLAAADGGDRPPGGLEAYKSASRTYPADLIPPAMVANARATFEQIAAVDAKTGDTGAKGHSWKFYGPTQAAIQPGVTSDLEITAAGTQAVYTGGGGAARRSIGGTKPQQSTFLLDGMEISILPAISGG